MLEPTATRDQPGQAHVDHTQHSPLIRPEALAALQDAYGAPVRLHRLTIWTLTGFLSLTFIVVGAFLATNTYTRKETVSGVLEPRAGAIRVTTPRSAVISRLHVAEGDKVAAGAPIATLTLDPLIEGGERLGAILSDASMAQARSLQDRAKASGVAIERQLEEISAKRAGLTAQRARLQRNIDLQKRRVALNQASFEAARPLRDKGFVSELQLRQKEEAWLDADQDQILLEQELDAADTSLKALDAQQRRIEAEAQLAQAEFRGADAQLREKQAGYAAEREIVVTAPQAGRIAALQARLGAAASPSQPLAIMLPDGANLQAELWAPSKAVGFIKPGDRVRLMYEAFPYQRFGVGHGHVLKRADAPTNPADLPVPIETKEGLYRITVALDRQTVSAYGQSWRLAPGGRVSADLILESRSFLEWLLEPLLAARRRNEA
ncbi:HlyD family secretion protein [Caulobacter endophyticus]|uniref:HlyD family secretion protein n=1 Tax=Caulobacter endophyticus TaxID=2172652 RepID=UPI00240F45E1|nr:HlyD family efflux transporter periplasmic adaptor subunit [Caulobacter endophyticus]MDG2528976.1 HlyD family efflux transporter periplasmic adaptor subunit [Caulobacter endophyticus]